MLFGVVDRFWFCCNHRVLSYSVKLCVLRGKWLFCRFGVRRGLGFAEPQVFSLLCEL